MTDKFITIEDHINKDYKGYALYVIQSRGIPNFYDSLTPVQRLILLNSPNNFKKTVGVVGEVFSTGLYHHGDASMSQAIAKLARPFSCSDQLLIGDGFFGTPVNPSPSAPRYTQVKISPKYKSLIEKYKDLNVLNEEGGNDWIHLDSPIGLSTHIVGIAVGYKSSILPRKPEDIVSYLENRKKTQIKPNFRGFTGKVTRIKNLKSSSWLIEGDVEILKERKTVIIKCLSPLQRYDSFYNRLNNMLERSGVNYKLDNYSTENVKVNIKLNCGDPEFDLVTKSIIKETKQVVSENIVFVKDGKILQYETIEEYLDDFKVHKESVLLKRIIKDLYYLSTELEFLEAKLKFLIYMSEKKRSAVDVNIFVSSYKKSISRRLESISLIKLNKDEINSVRKEIKSLNIDIKNKNKELKKQEKVFKTVEKSHYRKTKSRIVKSNYLLEYSDGYHNGIKIWEPEMEAEDDEEEIGKIDS
jgi:DNA gyrase/topoisomerase IV subunit A